MRRGALLLACALVASACRVPPARLPLAVELSVGDPSQSCPGVPPRRIFDARDARLHFFIGPLDGKVDAATDPPCLTFELRAANGIDPVWGLRVGDMVQVKRKGALWFATDGTLPPLPDGTYCVLVQATFTDHRNDFETRTCDIVIGPAHTDDERRCALRRRFGSRAGATAP